MDNINKLMIITSPNGDEYRKFWNLGGKENPIVKNGYEGKYKIISESPELEYLEEIAPDLSNHLVMVHFHSGDTPNFIQRNYLKDHKSITYYLYFYSSLETQLNDDLWSIGDNYGYAGLKDSPDCPFDKLRMDIIHGVDTSASEKEIIDWVKKKVSGAILLEVQLDTLHQCLTPEGAAKVTELKNFDMIKNKYIAGDLTIDEFIKKKLAAQTDCFSESYLNNLTQLRDTLLEEDAKEFNK